MSEAPAVDLEQQKVSSVNWGQVASGNFFTDNDLQPKDLESTEAIDYLRKVLRTVLFQMVGMTLASLICCYFNTMRVLVGNQIVLFLSIIATVGFFILMHVKPDLRKDAPLNEMYLLFGSISLIVFYGSLSGMLQAAVLVTLVMGMTCAVAGLYGGALIAKSSTNREYLIRKLMTGVLVGFFLCIALNMFAMASFMYDNKGTVFTFTMICYLVIALYLGYVVVFVILPGHAENKEDYIWGVIRLYLHIGSSSSLSSQT